MSQAIQVTSNSNPILSDYLLTQKVDPMSLSDDRLKKDLELLKKAEIVTGQAGDDGNSVKLNKPIVPEKRYETLQEQEMDALKIQNPFKGV